MYIKFLYISFTLFISILLRYLPNAYELEIMQYYMLSDSIKITKSVSYYYAVSALTQCAIIMFSPAISILSLYILMNLPVLISLLLVYFSDDIYIFILSRAILGINAGFLFPMALLYAKKFTPHHNAIFSTLMSIGMSATITYHSIFNFFTFKEAILYILIIFTFIFIYNCIKLYKESLHLFPTQMEFIYEMLTKKNISIISIVFLIGGMFAGLPETILSDILMKNYDYSEQLITIFFVGFVTGPMLTNFIAHYKTKKILFAITSYLMLFFYSLMFTINYYMNILILFLFGVCGAFYFIIFMYLEKKINIKYHIQVMMVLNLIYTISAAILPFCTIYINNTNTLIFFFETLLTLVMLCIACI